MNMSLVRVIAMVFLVLSQAACGLSGGPVEGRILEAGTNKPIAGAIVVVRWQGSYSQIVDSQDVCYHVETATTDAQGRYRIPAWRTMPKGPMFSQGGWFVDAYKAGYVMHWPRAFDTTEDFRNNVYYLAPFKGARGERMEQLRKLSESTRCSAAGESEKAMLVFAKAAYAEAVQVAKTPGERDIVESLLFQMEWLEFGYEAAERNQIQRLRGQR